MNEAANDSARVSGQDRKKLPALATNQIAGFQGFRPPRKLRKKIKHVIFTCEDIKFSRESSLGISLVFI